MIQALFRRLRSLRLPLLVLALLAVPPAIVGCSAPPAPKDPAAAGAAVRDTARLAYSAGVLALSTLEEGRIVWQRAQTSPSPTDIEIGERLKSGLHAARDALERARPWLETGAGEAEAKRSLREGLESASLVARLLLGSGGAVPKVVTDGLDAALAALGGAS